MIQLPKERFSLYLPNTFFVLPGILILLYSSAYAWPGILSTVNFLATVCIAVCVIDLFILFFVGNPVLAVRQTAEHWGLADENKVQVKLRNRTSMPWRTMVIDEIPVELQKRNHRLYLVLPPGKEETLTYALKPLSRGLYEFGYLRVFLNSPLQLFGRRLTLAQPQGVKVYPSILQMKQYSLLSIPRIATHYGIKKMRKIGHSYEFEQIKDYVQGDDIRSINWRATGRRGQLMVNQYEDERSQQVYVLIDKSRNMQMPFDGLSLLDYAINASLVISNVSIQKHDKAGLLTYSDKLGTFVNADRKSGHMSRIIESLYNQKPRLSEADPELLYNAVTTLIRGRSLLFLFTNFESINALERALPVLRQLNHRHLLVVVFFENPELRDFAFGAAEDTGDMFTRVVAQQFVQDKRQIAGALQAYGIQAVLTEPSKLSISVLNKYLELKARGLA